VTERLAVAVNAGGPRTLEAPEAFAAGGEFVVALTNHGDPTHVHLALDGELADAAALADTHPFVERDATETVRIDLAPGTAVSGQLRIATGHGATTRTVEVEVDDPEPVRVDESLASPADEPARDGVSGSGPPFLPVAVAAVVLAVVAGGGVLVGGAELAVGAVVVAAAGLGAAYAVYRFAA